MYRIVNGNKEFLLVSAKRCSLIWVLPKGHIKLSESEEQAAVREVKEESGLKVSIIEKIGNAERMKWNLKKQVTAFYLMEFKSVISKNHENRKLAWLPIEKAVSKLFYAYQRKILKQ